MDKRRKIGEGVYAEWDGDGMVVEAEIFGAEPQRVLLDPESLAGLNRFMFDFMQATKRGEAVE